jgi:sugar lactone lactonase YvrE
VSGGDAVMASTLGRNSLEFAVVDGVDEREPSGMAFNRKGDKFFVADRKKREVHSYDVSSAGHFSDKKKIISNMPDDPEFLVYTQS